MELKIDVLQCDPDPVDCPDRVKNGSGSYSVSNKGLYQVRLVAEAIDAQGNPVRREQLRSVYFTPEDPFSKWYWWVLLLIVMALILFALHRISRAD